MFNVLKGGFKLAFRLLDKRPLFKTSSQKSTNVVLNGDKEDYNKIITFLLKQKALMVRIEK